MNTKGLLLTLEDIEGGGLTRWIDQSKASLEIEIGTGTGTWLCEYAVEHPDRRVLGVEMNAERCQVAATALALRHVKNVRVANAEADALVRNHILSDSVAAIHVYFPTPYARSIGLQHRLMTTSFCAELYRVLIRGGLLLIATDHEQYFRQIQRALRGQRWWSLEWQKALFSGSRLVGTPCEKKFGKYGIVRTLSLAK